MTLRTALSLAILLAGVALLYVGWQEAESFASEVSRVVSGSPTDRSLLLMVGGGILTVVGGATLLQKG